MNFKEMYLNGMCPFEYIESCAEQWRSRPDLRMSAAVYLGLTHEEYQMYLQMVPGASLKEHLDSQRRTQKFRVYQLDFKGIETHTFAFRSMEAMRRAGYEQPPADSYQLVYDGELTHPKDWPENMVLERIFCDCNDDLPEGYLGRSLSMSDVVELYDGEKRRFFYCDTAGFAPVQFDTTQIKAMAGVSADG